MNEHDLLAWFITVEDGGGGRRSLFSDSVVKRLEYVASHGLTHRCCLKRLDKHVDLASAGKPDVPGHLI